jgi:peptide/nickel transport system permease protein
MATEIKQDYWSYVRRQFSSNKRALYSFYIIVFMAMVAIFADFLANEKPIYCQYKGQTYFPIFRDYGVSLGLAKWPKDLLNINWLETTFEKCIRTPIPYSTTNQDFFNSGFVSPFGKQDVASMRWRHWLGTDDIGRDITAGLIHGTRIAFIVGIISMSIASFIGILLGAIAGFYGDDKIQLSRAAVIMGILFFFVGWFYAFMTRSYDLSDAIGDSILSFLGQFSISLLIFFGALLVGYLLSFILKIIPFFRTKVNIPVDIIVQRMIEILVSIPRLFLIIAVIAISKPGIVLIMVIIGLTSWTEIARFIRAELLKVRNLEYIEASEALGYSRWRILFKHAIPNAIAPVLITVAFGIAAAVLIESSLSFLGIGVPAEVVTWGKILAKAQGSKSQLWVAIFPGIAIFLTVTLFNLIGEGLTDALDPRQKK